MSVRSLTQTVRTAASGSQRHRLGDSVPPARLLSDLELTRTRSSIVCGVGRACTQFLLSRLCSSPFPTGSSLPSCSWAGPGARGQVFLGPQPEPVSWCMGVAEG